MTEHLKHIWRRASLLTRTLFLLLLVVGALVAWAIDTDNDGMSDEYELFFGLNTLTNDPSLDLDSDGLNNLAESQLWTDPFVSDTDRDGFPDGADSNPVSRAVIPWGNPYFTYTNSVVYTWPNWMLGAFKIGGEWDTNLPGWQVFDGDTNLASLSVELDRTLLTNDLRARLWLGGSTSASLYLDLYDTNGIVVATNVAGNLVAGAETGAFKVISIPLEMNATAAGLWFRYGTGDVTVAESLFYVDMDGDGLDAAQEAQLGTSDLLADTDGDGFPDQVEFQAGTDPLSAGNHPPTVPTVSGSATTNLTFAAATLQGTVTSTGCAPTTVFCYWGHVNGGIVAAAWSNVVNLGVKPEGSVSCSVTGLLHNTTYRYRYAVTNVAGMSWATSNDVFATPGCPYKMPITFSGYTRGEPLTNFPVMVVFSNNVGGGGFDYRQVTSTNGYDLRFTNSAGTVSLNYEIEKWDTNGTSVVWVQVPLLTNNTSIWASWGNPDLASSPMACTTNGATWDGNFKAVWHLGETVTDEATGGTNHFDGTTNRNNGIQYGNDDAVGKIGKAQDFDGTGTADYLQFPGVAWTPSRFSVSFWIRPDTTLSYNQNVGSVVGWGAFNFHTTSSGQIYCGTGNNDTTGRFGPAELSAGTMVTGVWQQYTFTFDSGAAAFYKDGARLAAKTLSSSAAWGGFRLSNPSSSYLDGLVDECRIDAVARSSNWVWACWMNQASNQTFSSYGALQEVERKDPPWVVAAASALPDTVTGTNSILTVLGGDYGGEESLNYTWSTNGSVPASVAFSVNGNNAAKTTTVIFSKSGSYSLKATIRNWDGVTTSSVVGVTVNQSMTLGVSPASCIVTNIFSRQFTVTALDQFGIAMAGTPTWSVSGGGLISTNGLFTAIATGGTYAITATLNGFATTATVQVVSADSGPDADLDGLPDSAESGTGTYVGLSDTGTSSTNWDSDSDGIGDGAEVRIWGTDPTKWDTDGDGLADGMELQIGTDPTQWDTDGDGLSDGAELQTGTAPLNGDTDGDGFSDGEEVQAGTDPLNAASHPPTVPIVNGCGAINVDYSTATFQGAVTSTGCAPTTVFCYWGRADGGTNAAAWSNMVNLGIMTEEAVTCTVTGLVSGTTYRYRYAVTNIAGMGWATSTVAFATAGSPYKMPITFGGYTKGEALTNFPVMVVFSNNVGGSGFNYTQMVSTAGNDLQFTNDSETASVNYEIERWSTGGVSVAWVQVPVLTNNARVWAYWGNPALAASAASCTTNGSTWSANYAGVYHLTRTNSQGLTPTSAGTNDATLVNVPSNNVGVVGKIAGAFDFTDSGDYATMGSAFGLGASNATLSCWVNLDSTSESGAFIKIGSATNGGYGLGVGNSNVENSGNKLVLFYEGIRWIPTSISIGTGWHHVAMVVDGSGYPRAYLDGSSVYSDTSSQKATSPGVSSGIGGYYSSNNRYVDATMDEVEIASVARSSNWIWACWINQTSNQTFSSYGAMEQTVPKDAPWIVTPAAASPSTVTGTNSVLTVLGGDCGGEGGLVYTWSTNGSAPAAVTFNVNGNNAAKTTTVTFAESGSYYLKATVGNADGVTTSSVVGVTVNQILASLAVIPSTSAVYDALSQQFAASGVDQFGCSMSAAPAWNISGGGTIDTNGWFTAASKTGGEYTVSVTCGGVTGTASVVVTPVSPTAVPPVIGNGAGVTNGTLTTATLQGTVISTGGAPTGVYCYWGPSNGGTNSTAWSNSVYLGMKPEGPVSCNVTGLIPYTVYGYRYMAVNAAGTNWAVSSVPVEIVSYPRKMPISFAGYTCSEPLTNFPVLVVLSNNVGGSGFNYEQVVSSNGYDLRFMDSDETTNLNHEIDTWNTNGASAVWVQVPLLTSNTSIWASWGDPDLASSPAPCTTNGSTWDSSFKAVWHLGETVADEATGGTNHLDNSTNGNSGIQYGNDDVGGKVGKGQEFDGTGTVDYIQFPGIVWTPTRFSVSFWIKPDTTANYSQQVGSLTGWGAFNFHTTSSGEVYCGIGADDTTGRFGPSELSSGTMTTGVWQHYTFTFDSGSAAFYKDGVRLAAKSLASPSAWGGFRLSSAAGSPLDGVVDECRIDAVARSSNWIWACWMNQASNSTFNSFGAVQDGDARIYTTIIVPAAATPDMVIGSNAVLTVLGGDEWGEEYLTYTWATNGAVPAAATFDANGNNAAKTSVVTFAKAGVYSLKVTIQNWHGMPTSSVAAVTVTQTLTSLGVLPSSCVVINASNRQFEASIADQFGNVISAVPVWSVSGVGTIDTNGCFTAASKTGGECIVVATYGGLTGTASVVVVPYDGVNVSGAVSYSGEQQGPIRVIAARMQDSWLAFSAVEIPSAGAFTNFIQKHLATWMKAYCDSNTNGVRDAWEASGAYPSNPLNLDGAQSGVNMELTDPDTDGDGICDYVEILNGTNPFVDDGALDADGDGLSNQQEYSAGTNPTQRDSDGDGIADGQDATATTSTDSDGDGMPDDWEMYWFGNLNQNATTDHDGDGLSDLGEFNAGCVPLHANQLDVLNNCELRRFRPKD